METYGGTGAFVSGCEDDEDLVVARPMDSLPNCSAVGNDPASPDTTAKHSCTQNLACGGQDVLKNGGLSESGRGKNKASTSRKGSFKVGSKRSLNSIRESGRGVKRSQPTMANGSVKEDPPETGPLFSMNKEDNIVQAFQFEAKGGDAEKTGAALLGCRFNDVPAIVPIKKRRIHLTEVMRSPSPPPRPISPGIASSPESFPSPSLAPLSDSPRAPSSLARSPPLSLRPSRLPSRSPSPESRSPLSSSLAPPPMSSLPRSPFPELLSPPSCSQTPPPRSPSLGSVHQSAISRCLPHLVSMVNADAGNVTVACSGGSHSVQMMESNKEGLAMQSSLLLTQPLSPRLLHNDNNIKEEEEEGERFTSSKGCSDEEDFDMAVDSEESAREARMHDTIEVIGQRACLGGIEEVSGRSKTSFSQDDRLRWDLNMEMEAWERLNNRTAVNESDGMTKRKFPCTSISVDSNESKHNEKPDVRAEALVQLQAAEEHETEKRADLGTSECRDEDDQSIGIGEMVSLVSHDESYWTAEGAADNVEFDNPVSWEGETGSDGEAVEKSWMEEEPQNNAQADYIPDSKLEKDATSSRTRATGRDQVSEEIEAEENVDYGDSDWRDVEDVGFYVDEKASVILQSDINWRAVGETGNLQDNSACQEVDTVSNEAQEKSGLWEEGLKASFCESQISESSLEKDGNSGRSKFTGWDQLPEGFENVEEAWKVVKERTSHNRRGWSRGSLQRRGSFLNSQGNPRGSEWGSRHAASRDSFASLRGERFLVHSAHSDELPYARKSFGRGRWLDDSHNGNSKFASCDGRPVGKFGRGRVAGFHGLGRAGRWTESGGSFGEWGSGRGHENAAAVAAAKVESSGFVVAPDGTVTKAGGGIASSRGGIRSMIAGRRGAHRPLTYIGRGPVDVETAVTFPSRVHVGTGRGMVGTSSKVGMNMGGRGFGPNVGQGNVRIWAKSGKLVGQGTLDKYRGSLFGSGGMEHWRIESPRRLLYPLDHSSRNNHTSPSFRPDFRVEIPNKSPSHRALGQSNLVPSGVTPIRGSSSPSSKWSGEKREVPGQDSKPALHHPSMASRRTWPHVTHESSSTEERGRQVLSEAQHSPSLRAGLNSAVSAGKLGNCGFEIKQVFQNEDDDIRVTGSQPREGDYCRTSPKEYDKDRVNKDSLSKRDRFKHNDRRRDWSNLSAKDGRSIRGHKRAGTWEEDDDVAPRRRRPS